MNEVIQSTKGPRKEKTDLSDDVCADFLVHLLVHIPDHPSTLLHLFWSAHLVCDKDETKVTCYN